MAAVAGFELLRVPLAKAFQRATHLLPRLLALVAITALIGVAFENWTLGLERTVNQRIAPVEQLRDDVRQAQQALASQSGVNDGARIALREQVDGASREFDLIERQIAAEHARHKDNMERVKDCLKLAIVCYQSELDKESKRYDKAKNALETRRDQIAASRDQASAELLALSTNGHTNKLEALRQTETRAQKALASEVKNNPIYRIASAVYSVAPENLTDEQVANTRAFFAMFGAAIVSFTGTAAALIHYWPEQGSSKLAWALRAYIARLRRKVVRIEKIEVPVVDDAAPSTQWCYIEKTSVSDGLRLQIATDGSADTFSPEKAARARVTWHDVQKALPYCDWFKGANPHIRDKVAGRS